MGKIKFPFEITLVLRRETLYREKYVFLFQSRSYNCTLIGSSRIEKWTNPRWWRASQWLFSPLWPAKMGGASGYIISCSSHRNSDFFSSATNSLLRWLWDPPLTHLSSRIRTSCIAQLADLVIPCSHLAWIRRASKRANFTALLPMLCRHCKTCISPLHADDTHAECVSCLGKSHADAMLSGADCSHCESFSLASLRSRIAFFSESDSAPRALPFSSSQGPVRKRQRGRGSEQPVTSELASAQCPHIHPSRAKPHLHSLDVPTQRLDRRLQRCTRCLCFRSFKPRCSPPCIYIYQYTSARSASYATHPVLVETEGSSSGLAVVQ